MKFLAAQKRKIAITLLLIMSFNLLAPLKSFALTSGPAQPETQGFQPAGVSDMVDLSTGEFKYNIPLLDIDGYPINLNYQGNVGMDDEASWVGLGWSLNPGAINRQVRGLPDDMAGDQVVTENYTKPKVTVRGKVTVKGEFLANNKLQGSLSEGIFVDSYTGIGAEIGANAGLSIGLTDGGGLTAGLGLGINSNTSSGVDVSPYANLSLKKSVDENQTVSAGISASLGYNTRSGLKSLTLSGSFGDQYANRFLSLGQGFEMSHSFLTYNTEPIYPKIDVPFISHYGSFSLDGGYGGGGAYVGGGFTGYKSVREVQTLVNSNPAFGFLYAERGKNQTNAVMDFIREKESPIIPELPNLALPVQTPDIFTYTNQTGSGQFRLYRGGTGEFFDNEVDDASDMTSAGLEVGFGAYFHGTANYFKQTSSNTTRKWVADNYYNNNGDFQNASTTNPAAEHVYFKQVGEKSVDDGTISNPLHGTSAVAVNIRENIDPNGKPQALSTLRDSVNGSFSTGMIRRNKKAIKRANISYLTAQEAGPGMGALDPQIISYPLLSSASQIPANFTEPTPDSVLNRVAGKRQPHHISEITVTDETGKRSVYGIPVYNLKQDEYTFAVGSNYNIASENNNQPNNNQVDASSYTSNGSLNYNKGIDNYYKKESQPAYASSYLLTAILSPDYQDKTGNGISDDDAGTAIKFNYSKLHQPFKWRSPYKNATLNRCLLADADDDKASIVYGEKEIWYIHSIESKTKIAYFISKDRDDALGVNDWLMGGLVSDTSQLQHQRCLTEIRLYSKADMSKPIKVVKFEYNYQLCPGVPNSVSGGKLTLTKVYFEYGNATKGINHPYTFYYNKTINGNVVQYSNMSTDRWGQYKPPANNTNAPFNLQNEEFPYTVQNKATADSAACLWKLSQIDLPTGGVINVKYESGDYAYVQDKKAMVMTQIQALVDASGQPVDQSNLQNAAGVQINLSPGAPALPAHADTLSWFKRYYLSGSDYLYTKLYVKVATGLSNSKGQEWDFVPCYAQVIKVIVNGSTANVIFKSITDPDPVRGDVTANPMVLAAWQKIKEEYPRYAYPGFDTRGDGSNIAKSVISAVSAIVSAFGNLDELKENFYQKAQNRHYANNVDLSKSFVRLTQANGFKLGGSPRVKQIQISDSWSQMANNSASGSPAVYGQAYDYTTTEDDATISSGVAAYEPSVGNDENPLKQPVFYTEHIQAGMDNFHDLETPFGESFYPAPSVVYSKVTLRDLDENHVPDPLHRTGYIVNEFYTAKDFPVQVHVLPIKELENKPTNEYSLFSSNSLDELCMSQGYSIEVNDMHGKPKATRVLNQSGAEISSTVYYYNTTTTGAGQMKLRNVVNVVNPDGTVSANKVIGRDIDFFTDCREQESVTNGQSYNVGVDVIDAVVFPIAIFDNPIHTNYDYKLFRSVCAVKVSQYYGIVDKVVKTVNGSSITTQNIAYDGLTGEPLVTRTENEFGKDIYQVNLPAYWVYKGMGPAYQTAGTLLSGLTIGGDTGSIEESGYASFLQPGDELADLSTGNHYWVIYPDPSASDYKYLIDRYGNAVSNLHTSLLKVIRSGFRNMLGESASSIVCLNNPIVNGQLQLTTSTDNTAFKVINASANTYDESWATKMDCSESANIPLPIVNPASATNNFILEKGTAFPGDYTGIISYDDFGNIVGPPPNVPLGYNALGANINDNGTYFNRKSHFWGGGNGTNSSCQSPLIRCGFWLDTYSTTDGTSNESWSPIDEWVGFETCLNIPATKIYYLGYSCDDSVHVYIDNVLRLKEGTTDDNFNAFEYWTVDPVSLTQGSHTIRIEAYNHARYASAGVEIYNNTVSDLLNADDCGDGINTIFTTANFLYQPNVQTFYQDENGTYRYHYIDKNGTEYPISCGVTAIVPGNFIINPYIWGYLGNWHPYQTMVYQQSRNYNNIFNPAQSGVDVKNAGYINGFYSYWTYGLLGWAPNTNGTRWVTANTVTLYDKYGQQLENKDALGRYSAAKFDFYGELPSAVASNAMNREIYASGFEDTKFTPGGAGSVADTCNLREFVENSTGRNIRTMATSKMAHSGNYSVQLPSDGVNLSTICYNQQQKALPYLGVDYVNNQYITKNTLGLYPNGFEPMPNKQYIFDAWINDGLPKTPTVNQLTLNVNGVTVPLKCKAIVEGWKLVEGTIDLNSYGVGSFLNIGLMPVGSNIYIDDIRIHPFDAHLKTYAYDDKTMRLMAELDENAFATFYEYDDEGLLVRVKKETQRGIMTLKESRSSYKVTAP